MVELRNSTRGELMRLSPEEKLDVAAWLVRESLEEKSKPDYFRLILSELLCVRDDDILQGAYFGMCTNHRVQEERNKKRSEE